MQGHDSAEFWIRTMRRREYFRCFFGKIKWVNVRFLFFFADSFVVDNRLYRSSAVLILIHFWVTSLIPYSKRPLEEKWELPETPKRNVTKFPAPEVDQYQLQHQHSFDKVGCQSMKLSAKKRTFSTWSCHKNYNGLYNRPDGHLQSEKKRNWCGITHEQVMELLKNSSDMIDGTKWAEAFWNLWIFWRSVSAIVQSRELQQSKRHVNCNECVN